MNNNQHNEVVIVTATSYPNYGFTGYPDDELRGGLALQTVQEARLRGFPVVVVDHNSSDLFLFELREKGVEPHVQKKPGMSAGRQEGFAIAVEKLDAKIVVWIEPEKANFVAGGCIESVLAEMHQDTAIAIPRRTERGLYTLPVVQQATEKMGNSLYMAQLRDALHVPEELGTLDMFFGPRIFRLQAYDFFMQQHLYKQLPRCDTELHPGRYSNALFFPIPYALNKGLQVQSILVDYEHPREQTELEFANTAYFTKRIEQVHTILLEQYELLKLLKGEQSALALVEE